MEDIAELEIPACELINERCIGTGVTSEVYKGYWTRINTARAGESVKLRDQVNKK